MGYEQLSLHGLVLVERRRVHYGPHDPAGAREVFVRHALVRGEISFSTGFLKKNAALVRELAEHEHKRRRHDVLATEDALEAFFCGRGPLDEFTDQVFGGWYEKMREDARESRR